MSNSTTSGVRSLALQTPRRLAVEWPAHAQEVKILQECLGDSSTGNRPPRSASTHVDLRNPNPAITPFSSRIMRGSLAAF